ncbi:MAG: hypothetical protein CL582_16720 [Alteromonadaceae bacterium]|nr:hypothetical protein [Alteromonadaceae bacterium]|tara:strand:- start:961 stop:1431 length:471 start_codon:yes stop_codon:yes gene_type:complete
MGRKRQGKKESVSLEKLQLEMKETLETLGDCIQVVSASSRNGDMRFLCRVIDEEHWLQILASFLANEGNWYSFIGKKYFISNAKVVFGWVLIFESDELDRATQEIRKLFLAIRSNMKRPTSDIISGDDAGMQEVPLPFVKGSGFESKMQERVRSLR